MFFITLPDRIACEFVTAVPLLSVACLLVIFVFMFIIFPSIFVLSYASTPVTVIPFAVDDKLIPVPGTMFFITVPDRIACDCCTVT